MTRLLVSVRDPAEARIALEAGVDLIDVKEPARGSLGAATRDIIAEIIRVIDGRVPSSAALGELVDAPDGRDETEMLAGLTFVKWGLAGCGPAPDWPQRFTQAATMLPPTVAPVAVVYADWRRAEAPPPAEVLHHASRLGCGAVLVDTFRKDDGDLFCHWSDGDLRDFVAEAQASGMSAVVGGSLRCETLPRALNARPDFVAVRGAACHGSRTGGIDAGKIRALRAAMVAAGSLPQRRVGGFADRAE